MAVLNSTQASSLDNIQLDKSSPANINYVKARMAIEAQLQTRSERRAAKMAVISYLNGEVRHPDPADKAKGATNQVVFEDNTKARF